MNTPCEDCELMDCECDFMEVYFTGSFNEFIGNHTHLQPYRNFRYFQCWGGGPEGGFIHSLATNEIFKVNRTWGEPFTVEPVDGTIDVDGTRIRIVPKN
jgi:hypothetical protein